MCPVCVMPPGILAGGILTVKKKIMLPVLDDRLLLIASKVREGSVPLDVGTDHAYIPIYLIKSGHCDCAVATDIKTGPLGSAAENARRFGVEDKILLYRADGIDGAEPARNDVTDIIIAGMGGELIADIISRSDYTRIPGVRLILQPMSSLEELRGYLAESGYEILDERLCCAAGRYYTVIVCEYDGVRREVPPVRLEIGNIDLNEADPLVNGFLDSLAKKYRRMIEGKRLGGLSVEHEEEMLRELREIAAARGHIIE